MVLLCVEFNLIAIVQICNIAPWFFTHLFLLFEGCGNSRRALLKLDGINTGVDRRVDHLLGNVQIAVMIDADFRNDVSRMTIPHPAVSNLYFTRHVFSNSGSMML